MNIQQNINLVKKLFDEYYTKGNIALADQVFTVDVKLIDSSIPNFKGGLSSLKQRETMYKTAFPNKTVKIDDVFAVDDKVVVRWTAQGTHKGELQDIAPTGKNFKIWGITIYTFSNDKISTIHNVWDRLGLLEQIGVIEPAEALHH